MTNPGPNARYCDVCGQRYLAAEVERVDVNRWRKRMPCQHVVEFGEGARMDAIKKFEEGNLTGFPNG